MNDQADRKRAFEARLSALKRKMEQGLAGRARDLRLAVAELEQGQVGARESLKAQAHRLRGIAGTYGHGDLTDAACRLEQTAMVSPAGQVAAQAVQLAEMAEHVGANESPPSLSMRAPRAAVSDAATSRPARGARPARPSVRGENGGPLRVLAIDDDPLTVRLLTLTLRDVGGFDATIVGSATEGLARLRAETFDLVISDAMMPDMNGRDFSAAARALGGAAAEVPILILSAAMADELGWTRENSCHTGWLRKPFRPSELVADLGRFIDARRAGGKP